MAKSISCPFFSPSLNFTFFATELRTIIVDVCIVSHEQNKNSSIGSLFSIGLLGFKASDFHFLYQQLHKRNTHQLRY